MIPELRRAFNSKFSGQAYQRFLRELNSRCGTEIKFRVSETPCFFAPALLNKMAEYGEELVQRLLSDPKYRKASDDSVSSEFKVPREDERPLFVSVDFGLVKNANGELEPKLVELQAFPTLYAYQPALAKQYIESFGLPPELSPFFEKL